MHIYGCMVSIKIFISLKISVELQRHFVKLPRSILNVNVIRITGDVEK